MTGRGYGSFYRRLLEELSKNSPSHRTLKVWNGMLVSRGEVVYSILRFCHEVQPVADQGYLMEESGDQDSGQ